MFTKKLTIDYSQSVHSLINSNFLLSNDVGVILVCSHGNSRTIYIESNLIYTNSGMYLDFIEKYSIKFPKGWCASKAISKWEPSLLDRSQETSDEIQSLKNKSHIVKEYKVDKTSIQKFSSSMSSEVLKNWMENGDQDEGIIDALKKIDQTIEFSHHIACTIS